MPPEQRRSDRQRARAQETIRTEAHQSERARREAESEHDQTDLRRAGRFRSEPEAGRERDLGAVRRAGLGHEHERGHGDQRERADRARPAPLALAGQRRETGGAEHEHRDDHDPDRDGPREIDHGLSAQRGAQREVDDERDRQSARERRRRLTGPRAVEQREPPHPRRKRDDRKREVQPVATRRGEQQRRDAEDHPAQPDGAPWPEARGDDEREERRGEDGDGGDGEIGVRRAEERLLEGGAERAEVREQEQESDDSERHLADHARESRACPPR